MATRMTKLRYRILENGQAFVDVTFNDDAVTNHDDPMPISQAQLEADILTENFTFVSHRSASPRYLVDPVTLQYIPHYSVLCDVDRLDVKPYTYGEMFFINEVEE